MTTDHPTSSLSRWLWIAAALAVATWLFRVYLPGDWTRFESPEGGFSVEIPEAPIAKSRSINSVVGPISVHLYLLEHRRFSFMASYSDYPESIFAASTPQTMLDGARDGAALNIQGTVESDQNISLDGHPGRKILLADSSGDLLLEVRLFLVERRLYQVGVMSAREDRASPEIARYLDSFRLLPD